MLILNLLQLVHNDGLSKQNGDEREFAKTLKADRRLAWR